MKKYLLMFAATLVICVPNTAVFAQSLAKKEVIIFSQPCHYCELMKKDLNAKIIQDNPDITFTILDITKSENNKLLRKYVKQYNINGNQVGLPLLFIGSNHIMGWGENAVNEMNEYLEEFRQEKVSRIPMR